MNKKNSILKGNAVYVFLSIIIGFAVGAVLLLAAGISPGEAYGKLADGVFGQTKYIVWSIVYASPLIFTGLSVAFSFKTGVFNIGAGACSRTSMYSGGDSCRRSVGRDRRSAEGEKRSA